MAQAATRKNARRTTPTTEERALEQMREIKTDAIEYLTEYARENPGYAALVCLGVGFCLGWKLKPW